MDEHQQHTATARVQVMHQQFEMPQLGTNRRIWLYLPKDYETDNRSYPVIYMQDGQNLFDDTTASYGEWGVDEFMEQLPPKKRCIIVGIDHAEEDRLFEYNPFDTEEGQGKGSLYADFLVETLKPFIDKHYRTLTNAHYSVIAGSSLGGLIAMFTALKYPQVFGQACIFSPAFWIADQLYAFAQSVEGIGQSRFYFVCGDSESEGMVDDVQNMADVLRGKGISANNSTVTIINGAGHNEQQWHNDFPQFYNWLW